MPDQPHRFSKLAESLVGDLRGIDSGIPPRSIARPTQPLATLLDQLLTKHEIGRESIVHTLRDHWPAIVGSANATYSHAASIDRSRLIIISSHSVVRSELLVHRQAILDRVHQYPGCNGIKSLSIRAG